MQFDTLAVMLNLGCYDVFGVAVAEVIERHELDELSHASVPASMDFSGLEKSSLMKLFQLKYSFYLSSSCSLEYSYRVPKHASS